MKLQVEDKGIISSAFVFAKDAHELGQKKNVPDGLLVLFGSEVKQI